MCFFSLLIFARSYAFATLHSPTRSVVCMCNVRLYSLNWVHASPHFGCRAFYLYTRPLTLSLFHVYACSYAIRYCVFVLVQCWLYCVCRLLKNLCVHTRPYTLLIRLHIWIVGARSFLRVNVYGFIVLLLAYFVLLLVVWCVDVFVCGFFCRQKRNIERRWNGWRLSKMNIQQLNHGGSNRWWWWWKWRRRR